jgi:alkylhydroperoxidase family enzyme
VSEAQLRDLPVYGTSAEFSPLEKAVIRYAVEMSKARVDVPDELFATLREYFDDAQLVELTAAIAWENYRARFNRAFHIAAQGFSEGAYCPLPERGAGGSDSGDPPAPPVR